MNKVDFLNELYYYLSPLKKEERGEILEDFRAHFREGEAAGKTQEQICQELGSPFECAKQYVGDAIVQKRVEPKKGIKHNKTFWTVALIWNIIQAFISIPLTLGLFIASAVMAVFFCFVVPAISSVAFLVFAISSTLTVFLLGVITLLWAMVEIKECVKMVNKS